MLYKLTLNEGSKNDIEPVPFLELAQLNKYEKDLENILAENLLNKLFEDNALMLIHQERLRQEEADIYALTEHGDLVIFELKRGVVGDDAMLQILRYTQTAGQWNYDKLNNYYKKKNPDRELSEAHKEDFQLDRELTPAEFNRNQHLYVVGSAANERLAKSLTYWKSKGISVEFIPYRIYQIQNEFYFEFFAKPNDLHMNPNQQKGVILDTNRTYNEECVWDMLKRNRASAYGPQAYFAEYLKKGDFVFLSHKHHGIIAAGEVISNVKKEFNKSFNEDEGFVNVKWLTRTPAKELGVRNYLTFREVQELLNHNFYWARTLKTPYLSKDESIILIDALRKLTDEKD